MGGWMSYARMVGRNGLNGPSYQCRPGCEEDRVEAFKSMIRGDMRRMETDTRDEIRLRLAAERAGITVEQARKVMDYFFQEDYGGSAADGGPWHFGTW